MSPGDTIDGTTDHYLDGNAAAGPLSQIFAAELTSAEGCCAHCGATAAMAETRLYDRAPGLVLRCRSCQGVLLRLVDNGITAWLDLRGVRYLRFDRVSEPAAP